MGNNAASRKNWRPRYLDGTELQRRIDAAGMTQAALAAAAEVDPGHVSHWVAGHYGPDLKVITRVAAALPECDPADLMHEDGKIRYAELREALSAA